MMISLGGLHTIHNLYNSLNDEFKELLEQDNRAASFYELIKLPQADLMTTIIDCMLDYYNNDENCFQFGAHKLSITLEDVLYITGLPIFGWLVICNAGYDDGIFPRLFSSLTVADIKWNRISMKQLKKIAKNPDNTIEERKRAVILTVLHCVITHNSDGHGLAPNCAIFLEDVGILDMFSWGAALLELLFSGLYSRKRLK
ncbi:hypothetical protein C2S52_001486 [Perilla frutescens var. hirtella]|nr:hypothetical protein C2S52_001486 [Perilla frutescens var. hirtella]